MKFAKPKYTKYVVQMYSHYQSNAFQNLFFFQAKKYGFGSNFLKSSPLPALYQWLWQAKAAFVSKFSLYFHETLATQSSPAEMKALISRQGQACDYVYK